MKLSALCTGDVNVLSLALYRACKCGKLNVVAWLVEHTALGDSVRCLTKALQQACENDKWYVARYLMKRGAIDVNIELRNNNKNWPTIMHKIIDYENGETHLDLETGTARSRMTEVCNWAYVDDEDVNIQDGWVTQRYTRLLYFSALTL